MNDMNLVSVTPTLDLEIKQNTIKAQIISRLTELQLNDQNYKTNIIIKLIIAFDNPNFAPNICNIISIGLLVMIP